MEKRITLSELRKMIKKAIMEGPYDDISFDFMDKEDERKNRIKQDASESFYNKMAKDEVVVKEIFRSVKESRDKEEAMKKFEHSQHFNRVERYMDETYVFPELKSVTANLEIHDLLSRTWNKFFDKVYEKSIERINRAN